LVHPTSTPMVSPASYSASSRVFSVIQASYRRYFICTRVLSPKSFSWNSFSSPPPEILQLSTSLFFYTPFRYEARTLGLRRLFAISPVVDSSTFALPPRASQQLLCAILDYRFGSLLIPRYSLPRGLFSTSHPNISRRSHLLHLPSQLYPVNNRPDPPPTYPHLFPVTLSPSLSIPSFSSSKPLFVFSSDDMFPVPPLI